MGDKLKRTVSVVPQFSDGEQPSAAKLTSIGAQLQRASQQLEKAVGDIHDQSWPYSSLTSTRLTLAWGRDDDSATGAALTGAQARPLGIANLARLIGSAANLNPKMLGTATVTETVPTGVHQFSLKYVPIAGTASFSDATVFATPTTSANLNAAGEYVLDTSKGMVSTFSATAGGTVTYNINPLLWGGGANYPGARFNIIPDPNQTQTGAYELTITGPVAGKYTVTLPIISHQQSNVDGDSVTLTAEDVNYDAQLKLPKVLEDNFSAGETIPEGFLYLRNNTTNEVYEDATYEYTSATAFKISNVDLDDAIAAGDEFCVITVGTDITSSIDDLRTKLFTSKHDRSWGEPGIPASSIVETTAVAGTSGMFGPSEIPGNYFPQYLHRDGARLTFDDGNGNDYNGMRGDLLIGKYQATASPGNYYGTGESFRIRFGTLASDAPNIYRDSNNDLILEAAGASDRVRVQSAELIPEQGIMGPDGTNTAIKPYAKIFPNVDVTASPQTLSLTDLDNKTVMGFSVMVVDPAGDFSLPNDGGTDYYTAYFSVVGVTPTIELNFSGAGWVDTTTECRIVVWYN